MPCCHGSIQTINVHRHWNVDPLATRVLAKCHCLGTKSLRLTTYHQGTGSRGPVDAEILSRAIWFIISHISTAPAHSLSANSLIIWTWRSVPWMGNAVIMFCWNVIAVSNMHLPILVEVIGDGRPRDVRYNWDAKVGTCARTEYLGVPDIYATWKIKCNTN